MLKWCFTTSPLPEVSHCSKSQIKRVFYVQSPHNFLVVTAVTNGGGTISWVVSRAACPVSSVPWCHLVGHPAAAPQTDPCTCTAASADSCCHSCTFGAAGTQMSHLYKSVGFFCVAFTFTIECLRSQEVLH